MLTVLRDNQDRLLAACDWWLVDFQGRWDPKGAFVFVNQLDLNPGVNNRVVIRQIIAQIAALCPWTVGAYWERRNKSKSAPRFYARQQLLREEVRVA